MSDELTTRAAADKSPTHDEAAACAEAACAATTHDEATRSETYTPFSDDFFIRGLLQSALEMNAGLKNTYQDSPELWLGMFQGFAGPAVRRGLPIVSVGSGDGALELWLKLAHGCEMICVDPDPLVWEDRQVLHLAPDYATVPDLVCKRPELVGNCFVLFNWTFPNEQSYDYAALELLRPLTALSVYEPPGGAHSSTYHSFLAGLEPPAPSESPRVDTPKLSSEYTCVSYFAVERKGPAFAVDALAVVVHKSAPDLVEEFGYSLPPYEKFDQDERWERYRDGLLTACSIQ